jgi:folate-binding protein YgfZ
MRTAREVIALEALGIVRMRGADAVKFLQGQLSNDVARLSAGHSMLAGFHNPQGRAIALLRLVQWEPDDILAVLPRDLAGVVASRLSKFILRAKVKVADESAAWRVSGLIGARGAEVISTAENGVVGELPSSLLSSTMDAQVHSDGAAFVCVDDQTPRWLVISPADSPPPPLNATVGNPDIWRRLEVEAGQPQVFAATSEEFVAQMLNLDVLEGIAFDKGCYTGQEVIARAHYRGRVKRRMQRFVSREACELSAGDAGQLSDGRPFKVVLAAKVADGRCDFLAVTPRAGTAPEADAASSAPGSTSSVPGMASAVLAPTVAAAAAVSVPAPPAATTPTNVILPADPAPLPYSLPD